MARLSFFSAPFQAVARLTRHFDVKNRLINCYCDSAIKSRLFFCTFSRDSLGLQNSSRQTFLPIMFIRNYLEFQCFSLSEGEITLSVITLFLRNHKSEREVQQLNRQSLSISISHLKKIFENIYQWRQRAKSSILKNMHKIVITKCNKCILPIVRKLSVSFTIINCQNENIPSL